ncbi:MAG: ABC transporter permease subunit [Betaproteobacteria bacterium]|nr:ABC transporter permease subunit [Betaproteobacteria bacterium]
MHHTLLLKRLRHLVEPVLGIVCVLLLWHWIGLKANNSNLVPMPTAVWAAFVDMLDADLPKDIAASLFHLAVGYGLGTLVGLLLALLAASSRWLDALIDPFAEFLRPIGPIALDSAGHPAAGCGPRRTHLPDLLRLDLSHLREHPGRHTARGSKLISAAHSLGASQRLVVTHVILPAAVPSVIAGARLSLGVAWMSLVAGEIVGGDAGIGWRILWYQEFFQMDHVMAGILIVGVLGLIADALLRLVQYLARRWMPTGVQS